MPWTLAHPAAVLPLRRWSRHLPWPGLVVGSLSPDFGYYTGHFAAAKQAHSLPGLFIYCLPAALLMVLLLRRLGPAFVELLPDPHRTALSRLGHAQGWPGARELAAIALAVLVGAATHVAWDSLTHSHGWTVERWSLLRHHLLDIGGNRLYVYNALQHASSLVGAACLLVAYLRRLKQSPARAASPDDGLDPARRLILGVCLLGALAIAVPLAIAVAADGARAFSVTVVRSVIYATSAGAVLYVAAALGWWHWRRGLRRARPDPR